METIFHNALRYVFLTRDNTGSILCNVMEHMCFYYNYSFILYNDPCFQTFWLSCRIEESKRNNSLKKNCMMIFRQYGREVV